VQNFVNPGNSSADVLRFPAYDPATNNGAPELTATWAVGTNDNYASLYGLAVDPTGTYVAVTAWGVLGAEYMNGSTTVLYATNGAVVTNIDLGVSIPSSRTTDPTHHQDTDADWDAAGNLYYLDDIPSVWRAVSPPGANQSTTVALAAVQVIGPAQAPYITSLGLSTGRVTIHFTGGSSDVAGAFVLLSASVPSGPYSPAAGAVITGSGGSFQVIAPMNGPKQFYRLMRLATIPIQITSLRLAGGTVTINFTGSPGDSPSAFTLLSSAAVTGSYSTASGASISQLSPGVFQATVPANGPRQFYRIAR
jgi:hypothetical protein